MRGQLDKQAAGAVGNAVEVIDVSEHRPRRIPSTKWRELINKVWEKPTRALFLTDRAKTELPNRVFLRA